MQSLSYDKLREDFIRFLQNEPGSSFTDYNFNASGIGTIVNLLAYNSHMLGYYVKMLLNESFVDSSKLRESMMSHSKLVGYTPRGKKSAVVELYLRTDEMVPYTAPNSTEPVDHKVYVQRGTMFTTLNPAAERVTFTTLDDYYLTRRVTQHVDPEIQDPSKVYYTSEILPKTPIRVYEGIFRKWNFLVEPNNISKSFVIKIPGVDLDTIRVRVYDGATSDESVFQTYVKATSFINIQRDSRVFYVTTSEDGFYEIFFGDDVFGKSVDVGNKIEASFIVNGGTKGNGAGLSAPWSDAIDPDSTATGRTVFVDTSTFSFYDSGRPVADGGVDEETVESLRFSIPNHYRRQNRIVTTDDYKSIILSEYRNIDAINVWGGEEAARREYGKVFICIKPKYADRLSNAAKAEIAETILKRYGVVGTDPVFVDPDYIHISMLARVLYNKSETDLGKGQVEKNVRDHIHAFGSENLGTLNRMYSEVDLMTSIKEQFPYVVSAFSEKHLFKKVPIRYTNQQELTIHFGNPFTSIAFSPFYIDGVMCDIVDLNNNGILYVVTVDSGGVQSLVMQSPVGKANFNEGTVLVKPPSGITMDPVFNINGSSGYLIPYVTPKNPDLVITRNNIFKIEDVKVIADG